MKRMSHVYCKCIGFRGAVLSTYVVKAVRDES